MSKTFEFESIDLCLIDVEGIDPSAGRLSAFKSMAKALKRGELPTDEIIQWFCEAVAALEEGYEANSSQATKQRLLSRSFGFTPKQKKNALKSEGYLVAKAIHVIKVMEECEAEEAIKRYVKRNHPRQQAKMYDSVRTTYFRYLETLRDYYGVG